MLGTLTAMRIGIHCSTAGALVNAAAKALELGANCLQIFSSSPRMWRASMPSPADIEDMKKCQAEHDLAPLVIHDSYLINLAALRTRRSGGSRWRRCGENWSGRWRSGPSTW